VWLDNVQTSNGTLSLTNNTVMELNADAVQIINNSQNVRLKNNILWAGGAGHYALNVANTAQRGFSSDYNLIYFTGGAKFGFWQNDFGTLADWRYELGFDTHSLSADPLFVDGDGNDNVRGLQNMGAEVRILCQRDFSGTPAATLIDRAIPLAGPLAHSGDCRGQVMANPSVGVGRSTCRQPDSTLSTSTPTGRSD